MPDRVWLLTNYKEIYSIFGFCDHVVFLIFLKCSHTQETECFFLQNNCMLGMGSGQPNRVESLRIAFRKAGEEAKGAALASDAFFPFGKNYEINRHAAAIVLSYICIK